MRKPAGTCDLHGGHVPQEALAGTLVCGECRGRIPEEAFPASDAFSLDPERELAQECKEPTVPSS